MTRPKVHHVWVLPPNLPVEHQGFLFEWRQLDDGSYEGRVVYVAKDGAEVMRWLPRDRIRPAPSSPHTGSAYG